MSYGYLVTVAIFGTCTLLAVRAPRRPHRLGVAAYVLTLGFVEAPAVFLALFLTSAAPALLAGDLTGDPLGWAALAATAVVVAGFGLLLARLREARPVLERTVAMPGRRSPWWSWIVPWPSGSRHVERIGGLSYGPRGRHNQLDLYRHHDLDGPAPVLVYLHGGGYFSGSNRWEARALRYRMAEQGWVVVSARYGLRPEVGWPGHLVDAKRVVAWVRREAATYAMDPRTVVVVGSSAGGHLAAHLALRPDEPALQPGFEGVDTSIAGAVCLYGYLGRYYDDPTGSSDPVAHAADHAPPVLVVHGTNDSHVPVEGARRFTAHLRATSPSAVAYAELPGAQHGFDILGSPRSRAVLDAIDHFLATEVDGDAEDPMRLQSAHPARDARPGSR
jgi:acetyl esterase/lipase